MTGRFNALVDSWNHAMTAFSQAAGAAALAFKPLDDLVWRLHSPARRRRETKRFIREEIARRRLEGSRP